MIALASSERSFDVDAVMRKWGFVPSVCVFGEVWCGVLDNCQTFVTARSAFRFATLLLMRN